MLVIVVIFSIFYFPVMVYHRVLLSVFSAFDKLLLSVSVQHFAKLKCIHDLKLAGNISQ